MRGCVKTPQAFGLRSLTTELNDERIRATQDAKQVATLLVAFAIACCFRYWEFWSLGGRRFSRKERKGRKEPSLLLSLFGVLEVWRKEEGKEVFETFTLSPPPKKKLRNSQTPKLPVAKAISETPRLPA